MTIIGLDTLAIIMMMIVIAVFLTYILLYGLNIEFTKNQFAFVILSILLIGMFVEAWLRETGDELLLGIALAVLIMILVVKRLLFWRKRRRFSRK